MRLALLIFLALAATSADAGTRSVFFPKSILGLWAYEPEDCKNPQSEFLLTITPRSIAFYGSAYEVKRIVRRPDGSFRISGLRTDEGEGPRRTRDSLTLKLISPALLHVVTDGPEGHDYHRCRNEKP